MNEILKEEGVHCYKKEKVVFSSDKQKENQRLRSRRLYRELLSLGSPDVIMDDESYFCLRNDSIPCNSHYYASAKSDAPESLRWRPTKKFEEKMLVWIAISPKGISKPFFQRSGLAVNKEIYQQKCIIQRLLPFINDYHADRNILFWPDLASSHYASTTLQCFEDNDIPFVEKELNPPAVPNLRPIENFWGILKQEVYKNGWHANNLEQLKSRIRYILTKTDKDTVCIMMKNIKSDIRKFTNNCV